GQVKTAVQNALGPGSLLANNAQVRISCTPQTASNNGTVTVCVVIPVEQSVPNLLPIILNLSGAQLQACVTLNAQQPLVASGVPCPSTGGHWTVVAPRNSLTDIRPCFAIRRFTVLSHQPRSGAINASTVFALTLAIVAGLILTLVFKMVVLDRKTLTPSVAAATVKLTVCAVNVLDRQSIEPGFIKTIEVSAEERNRWLKEASNRKTRLLDGSQPVGRTTVKALRAEEPVFEDMLEPFQYPRPVSELLAPGKRAAIVEEPATTAMIQVGDHVGL